MLTVLSLDAVANISLSTAHAQSHIILECVLSAAMGINPANTSQNLWSPQGVWTYHHPLVFRRDATSDLVRQTGYIDHRD